MPAQTTPATPAPKSDRFPGGIPYIVGNEGAERFSYYGLRAILYVYLTGLFLRFVPEAQVEATAVAAAKAHATEVAHLFMAGVYAFPMIGAILADRLLGKYRVILWVSIIYMAGNAALAIGSQFGAVGQFSLAEWGVFGGLGLIAMGSGGIKPCVSANVGDQFTAENSHLVTKVFQAFYFIINYGSFFATLLIPLMLKWFGPAWAFALPGALMATATVIFWAGRDRFVKIAPQPGGKLGLLDFIAAVLLFAAFAIPAFGGMVQAIADWATTGTIGFGEFAAAYVVKFKLHLLFTILCPVAGLFVFSARQKIAEDKGFLAVLFYSLRNQKLRQPGMGYFDVARAHFGDEAAEGPPAVLRVMLVFSGVSIFWALFDQHSSTWVEQARQMNLVLEIPYWLGLFGLGTVLSLSLYGGVWLMLWVSNRTIPRGVNLVLLALLGAAGVAATVLQFAGGRGHRLELLPSQLPALNPLFVMITIPVLNFFVWGPLQRAGRELKPLQKMTLGMFLGVFAFLAAALLQLRVQAAPGQVHVLWQVLQYFLMTVSEVLVSTTGLEFAYTQAPRAMKSTIMGFWLLCVTLGNLIVAFLSPLEKAFPLSTFFFVFAGLMAAAAVVFALVAVFYKGKSYLQQG